MAAPYGLRDKHGVWRDDVYWHAHYPAWVYRYHPEWTVERVEWWQVDHERYPAWFLGPFWVQYPLWTFWYYDDHHVQRYAVWWYAHDPAWVYAHHPNWVEPYPRWMQADHARHPEWFRSAYWQKHPHDWRNPDEAYRLVRAQDRGRPGVGGPVKPHEYAGNSPGKPTANQGSSLAAHRPTEPVTARPVASGVKPGASGESKTE